MLDEILKEQKVEVNEIQKNRLFELFERFEKSDLNWGDYKIDVENGAPKTVVTFVMS